MADAIDELHAATNLYTRGPVVDRLLDLAGWPHGDAIVADPACGDGAFLRAALQRAKPRPGDIRKASLVRGWEIHPTACASARIAVREELEAMNWSAADAATAAQLCVTRGDFLTNPPPAGSIALLMGNPPFLRWAGVPGPLQDAYGRIVPRDARGDLLHAFLDACDRALSPDGSIAMVTADRWLMNETTADLRARLGIRHGIAHLSRLDPRESFHRPKFRRAGTPPRIHPVAVVLRRTGPGLAPLDARPVHPSQDGSRPIEEETVPLEAIANVRLAPWLGPRGIFVISRPTAHAAGIDNADLVPIIDTKDIAQDRDEVVPGDAVAILTYPDREPPAAVLAHLEATIGLMPPRGRRRGTAWWVPPERLPPAALPGTLLVPRIARRLRAIPLPEGWTPINHNLTIVATTPGLDMARLVAALRDPVVQADVVSRARRLENDFLDMTTKFIRKLRIPTRLLKTSANHE
jgi:hypothetical protein